MYRSFFFLGRGPRLVDANHIGTRAEEGRRQARIVDGGRAGHGVRLSRILLKPDGGAEAINVSGRRQESRSRIRLLENQDRQCLGRIANLLLPNLSAQ